MFEDPACTDCQLHKKCRSVCLPSTGDSSCKLAIFLDYPSVVEDLRGRPWVGDNARFVDYCLRRMSVDPEHVFRDYIVKCYPGKMPGPKADRMACVNACSQYRFAALDELASLQAMVVLGGLGCEAVTLHKAIGDKAGAEWEPASLLMRQYVDHVWVGYSPGLLKEKPAEAGAIYRVIWAGAEQAGLDPIVDESVPPYDFDV
jgi:uracil-DNA glycosylase family 4